MQILLLLYPRLISFEIDRGGGSARQGRRKERCQPGRLFARPASAIDLKIAQRPAGLNSPHKTFCFVFGLFKNEGLPQGMSRLQRECLPRDSAPPQIPAQAEPSNPISAALHPARNSVPLAPVCGHPSSGCLQAMETPVETLALHGVYRARRHSE